MAYLRINDFVKTVDGQQVIMEQRPFAMEGWVWQGFNGTAFRVDEAQLQTKELAQIEDRDGSMQEVWFRRRNRLEGRFQRKADEYDKRRDVLRDRRSKIREDIKTNKAMGLPDSRSDIDELRRIEERMDRLTMLRQEEEKQAAQIGGEEAVAPTQHEVTLFCDFPGCGKTAPENHHNPVKWLRAHRMGAHVLGKHREPKVEA